MSRWFPGPERQPSLQSGNPPRRLPRHAAVTIVGALAIASGLLTLAACATTPSVVASAPACPQIVEYDATFLAAVADELERLPADARLGTVVAEWISLRDQARACRGAL